MVLKDTLLYLSRNQRLHDFVLSNGITRKMSRRFVAGEQLEEAVEATRVLNRSGIQVALDLLGENVASEQEAQVAAQNYSAALPRIKQAGLDANVSVKLTALGLDLSEELSERHFRAILEHAQQYNIFVCADMEGSAYTERTVNMTLHMHKQFTQLGTVIQSYLHRSRDDVARLIEQGVRVRLVKGAYKEPPELAFQRKREVDEAYVQLMGQLLARGNFPAIATHDEAIVDATCKFARNNGIGKSAFEFQMLYGIRRDLQQKLVQQGYNVRIYVPYGSQWYPYFMRRLAERPANIVFLLSNALRR